MGDKARQKRLARIEPYLPVLRRNEEPKTNNKPNLLMLMQDLKDEGNTLFKESKFKDAWQHYCYALFIARQLERTFYHSVEKEFLATLFCNASLCCLKNNDFEEALKDADMALCCQKNNIKAMYRRCVALKELGRHKEALEQAIIGKDLDPKNFDLLVDELKSLTVKPGKSKTESSKSNKSGASNEWLEGTNALSTEKQRETILKNMPPKKKKGQQNQNKAQSQPANKTKSTSNTNAARTEDSDRDSDSSSGDDDAQFAAKMRGVQNQPVINKAPINAKTAAAPGRDSYPVNSKPQTTTERKMGLDNFSAGKPKATQLQQQQHHQQQKTAVNLQWPLEGYDFKLACRLCFVKEGEGPGGYKYRDRYPHSCSHDTLVVRAKNSPQLNWLKVRPRHTNDGNPHLYKYKMCMQFQNHQPCRIGETNCTFAHNHTEVSLWNLDRDKVFSISGFINDARKHGIYSSDMLGPQNIKSQGSSGNEPYIPGLQTNARPQEPTPPSPTPMYSPPPQQTPPKVPYVRQFMSPPQNTHNPTSGAASGLSQFKLPTSSVKQGTSMGSTYTSHPPPQPYPQYQSPPRQTFDATQRSREGHQSQQYDYTPNFSGINQPPPAAPSPQLSFSHTLPNLSQPPPSSSHQVRNPLPQYEFKLCCPICMPFTGRPWYYQYENKPHQCAQSILAFYISVGNGRDAWVQVRERAAHRSFKGNYVLCHSVHTGNIELCKFKENCSFAHNAIEQMLWKYEQEGKFDISEFIQQNQKHESTTGSSSSGMYVKQLLSKFGGYFRFICRDCFFAPRPMISSMGDGNFCSSAARHPWNKSKIIAHVKDKSYTPIDIRKFVHEGAFYLMCHYMHFCRHWLENKCRYAHSQVEKAVWMLERDTKITREELVAQSAQLYHYAQTHPQGGSVPRGPTSSGPSGAWGAPPPRTRHQSSESSEPEKLVPPFNLVEFCRTCWGKGQRSAEDGNKDKCVRGHSNFKVNSVFVSLPAGKEIRTLPVTLQVGMKLILCNYHPKCTRSVCNHPHGQEELEVWSWMMRHQIKSLKEMCEKCQEAQRSKTRKINTGESVISLDSHAGARLPQAKAVNQIVAPGDLVINEHYCQYCGISCNSARQWDDHCMSDRHIDNVNSDKEHQWNYRQPPWGQGSNLILCAKHMHNQSCQYSFVPDMYNLCKYAHSQEELDEWMERHEWRQMKRLVARERQMFSYTEALLEEYYGQDNSVRVISEELPDVNISCDEEQVLYKSEKNDAFTWTFEIHSKRALDKVALLHNRDRLHFCLVCCDDSRHQVASGDLFLAVDKSGNACYKVVVYFSGGMFGSFSQWVVFDFGSRPVLVKKLAVEIGDHLQHERVKELREDLSFDRWTSMNREILRAEDETLDDFTIKLLHKYKEPAASEDVVTMDSLTELNQHNYVHKMHKLLELEEITRQRIIASYNLVTDVTASETLQEPGIFLGAKSGDLFIKVKLSENLTEDTMAGMLVLSSVRTVLMAPVDSSSNKVYEASIVGESNYGYDGRGKEHIYLFVNAATAKALKLTVGRKVPVELQFQMDRKFFCRMHYALDSLKTTDVIFPDVVKFKPDVNQLHSSLKFRSNVLNDDQMTAVRHVVTERDGYTPPFIMYGPFGTGKTETLAQATMTLLKERANSRILICTQSNSAADLYITKHLDVFIKKGGSNLKILRLNAEERKLASVPKEILAYSYAPDGQKFAVPPKDYINQHHLVLTTVENSMQLAKLELHNFFTHIFVDEAGQTLECEILMPLTLASTKTCIVLTGDHHQIGPLVYSREARRQKFDVSLLVRLYNYYEQIANCGIAQVSERSQQSPLNIFLSINYRTKAEILRFISSVFYGGPENLKAFGQIPAVMGITPLMFYSVQGVESQYPDSTSYLNHAEAQEVVERVKELLDNWPKQWGDRDAKKVAVIATYSDQIKHVRKMLRQDRSRPYLGQVDVGPIHSFQGKEVRALFITTVRTVNLLAEPHIIRSLEAGEDIGDLGFMSNPKLLNTALTRTQSFVAVVGDPIALCLIGECLQVWRTYMKHCSNMKSVRPLEYHYDLVKNRVVSLQLGPAGRVVDMISKRSQENFRQSLGAKPSSSGKTKKKQDMGAAGDAVRYEPPQPQMKEDIFSNSAPVGTTDIFHQQMPTVKSSITPEHRLRLRQTRQFGNDQLSLSSTINCEDIIFQLAIENQGAGEAGDSSFIKSEGIDITEIDGYAILKYSPASSKQRGPFKLTSADEDFIAFAVHDEDTNTDKVYENWGQETRDSKLLNTPQKFLKCVFHVEGDQAYATVIGSLPAQLPMQGDSGHDVEIRGQLNRGHALNGDVVVVEVGVLDSGKLEGQVKGIVQRAQDPSGRLYVCTPDPGNPGIMTPINPDMTRMYCLTTDARIKLARRGNVCVYKFVSSSCIEFSHYEPLDPSDSAGQLFIVRYLTWEPGFTLPLGVVVGMVNPEDSIDAGMKVLEIDHNVQRPLRPQALEESDRVFPADFTLPPDLLQDRRDLTQTFCFTVSNQLTEDLEMAVSVTQADNLYEVGVHMTDVAAFVSKDSVLDQECEHRGGSVFPIGREPKHMLPAQASTDMCSLKTGFDRLALSVVVQMNEEGKMVGPPDVFRSIINSKQQFTHSQVEEILLNPEEAQSDYLKSCIIVLYQLTYMWRCERLGNGHFSPDLDPGKRLALHSHLMMNEVKLFFNSVVAELLLAKFPETTPLLIQPSPQMEKLELWKKANACHAFNSIPMTRAFLDNKVCRCTRACTCVFSYMRQQQLRNAEFLSILKETWLMICQAVSEEYMDYELAQDLISNPENMPQLAVAAHKLQVIQKPEMYSCSLYTSQAERKHHGLCVQAYTNFTDPLRRFISLVVQRLLIAYTEGSPSPYSSDEVKDICDQATVTERETEKFHHAVFLLHLASALQARPVVLNALVEDVDKESLAVSFTGMKGLAREQRTIKLTVLGPASLSATVDLLWEERVYEHSAQRDSQAQYSSEVKLDSDQFVCNIPSVQWQRLLIAAREKDEAGMSSCVQEISRQVGGEMELMSKNAPEVLSEIGKDGQMRHYVPFTFTLHESQTLHVQMCVCLSRGLLTPCIQLLKLTPCLDLCLEHRADPAKCFAKAELATQAKVIYPDESKYASEWLLPMLGLESAHRAVEEGERVTIHSISISWRVAPTPEMKDSVVGEFVLSEEFCTRSSFQPDLGVTFASSLLDGRSFYTEDPNFCLDYVCVRYSDLVLPDEPALDENVAVLVNNGQPVTWVGHCRVTAVTKSPEGYKVKIVLMKSSMRIPPELLREGQVAVLCTVEWICKTKTQRVLDVAVRGVQHASTFAKDILIGKKPASTIDPVPQDNSVLKNKMAEAQETLIAECYRQPFVTVNGGPGTGKSIMAARLAHLLIRRNQTADAFRQIHQDGYKTQLMICGPNEKSLDVITGYVTALNYTDIHIVRVYSEEIEEMEFPTSLSPKPSVASRAPPPVAVMSSVALHHLIRQRGNTESQTLLEQEMLLTMYGKQMATTVQASMQKAQAAELRRAQVILCTCATSARPILRKTTNIKQIIMDDAGQISEAEAIVPLVMHRGVNQLVLLGDLEMPGPPVMNEVAAQLGLSRSLLQRYSDRSHRLAVQFRNSPALCSFPSSQFYNSHLTTSPQSPLRPTAPTIPWPGEAGFPSVFCHVAGQESISEGAQRSCPTEDDIINMSESYAVTALVGALTQQHRVAETSILVLTMTKAQATLIKDTVPKDVGVATVMESIGREGDYVILSTVRGLPDGGLQRPPTSTWTRKHLGRVADGKLVNLAITRARAALFIIGNKDLLGSCEPWKSLIDTYRGRESLQSDAQDFLQSLLY